MADTSTSKSGTSGASSSGSVSTDETDELIASNKVEGTAVYNRQGERIGTLVITHPLIDAKISIKSAT